MLAAIAAFFCFSFTASATYIFNDLLDLEADRVHLNKRRRAFAAGDLSVTAGVVISFSLVTVAVITAAPAATVFHVPSALSGDHAGLFAAAQADRSGRCRHPVEPVYGAHGRRFGSHQDRLSPWLAAFSIFFFLSLAMVKRFSELQNLHTRGVTPSNTRGYLFSDLEQLRSFGTASAYASIVIFALYINGRDVVALYHHPNRMWLITPFMILWVSRVWLLASRGLLNEDPVVFALLPTARVCCLGLRVA